MGAFLCHAGGWLYSEPAVAAGSALGMAGDAHVTPGGRIHGRVAHPTYAASSGFATEDFVRQRTLLCRELG